MSNRSTNAWERGWFADYDIDVMAVQPVLNLPEHGLMVGMSIWFEREEDCEAFIEECLTDG